MTPAFAWMNGALVPWEDAKVHVRTEGFMRGASVFEGIRAYASLDGTQLYVFRNAEHLDRLFNTSMRILRMQMRWSSAEVTAAMVALLRANDVHDDIQLRPQVYFGTGSGEAHGFRPGEVEVGCVITATRPKANRLREGIKVRTSTWRRLDDQVMPPRVKAGANYLNSRYATVEAQMDGYDSAILLDARGKVAEGPGACVMLVRGGRVHCPLTTSGLLESITVDTLAELFSKALGIEIIRREIDRTELYTADEVFCCGTGQEIQPIVSVDRYDVGNGERGPVVKAIQDVYFQVVRGEVDGYDRWLLPVYDPTPQRATSAVKKAIG
jgi:branched-chain amino acid aminotransferase